MAFKLKRKRLTSKEENTLLHMGLRVVRTLEFDRKTRRTKTTSIKLEYGRKAAEEIYVIMALDSFGIKYERV